MFQVSFATTVFHTLFTATIISLGFYQSRDNKYPELNITISKLPICFRSNCYGQRILYFNIVQKSAGLSRCKHFFGKAFNTICIWNTITLGGRNLVCHCFSVVLLQKFKPSHGVSSEDHGEMLYLNKNNLIKPCFH